MYARIKNFVLKLHIVTCIGIDGTEKVRRFRTHFFAVRYMRRVWEKYSNILYDVPSQKKRKGRY